MLGNGEKMHVQYLFKSFRIPHISNASRYKGEDFTKQNKEYKNLYVSIKNITNQKIDLKDNSI